MQRWGSVSSLTSRDVDRKLSNKPASGFLKLEILIDNTKSKKSLGKVFVTIREAKGLSISEPYVKLYLSKDGKDVKGTKQKTKPQKKTHDPLFEEEFTYDITKKTPIDANSRVQVTIWEHARVSSCVGGMSFTFHEIISGSGVSGWFKLLSEEDGRYQNQVASRQEMEAAAEEQPNKLGSSTAPSGSTISLSRMRSSIKKKVFKKKDKKEKPAEEAKPAPVAAKKDDSDDDDDAPSGAFGNFGAKFGGKASYSDDDDGGDDDDDKGYIEVAGANRFGASHTKKVEESESEDDEDDGNRFGSRFGAKSSATKAKIVESKPEPTKPEPTKDDSEDEDEPTSGRDFASRFGISKKPKSDSESEPEEESSKAAVAVKDPGSRFGGKPTVEDDDESSEDESPNLGSRFGAKQRTLDFARDPDAKATPAAQKSDDSESEPEASSGFGSRFGAKYSKPESGDDDDDKPDKSDTEDLPSSSMKRSDSLTSLSSIASMNIISSSTTQGDLLLTVRRDRGSGSLQGRVSLTIKQARNLGVKQPYIKIYMSKNGHDIKSTKLKTKVQKSGVFDEQFNIPVTPDMMPSQCRLQITVWDHARVRNNEVRGGMSFPLNELTTHGMSGWFALLPYKESRSNYVEPRKEADEDLIGSSVEEKSNKLKKRSVSGSFRKVLGRKKKELPTPGAKKGRKQPVAPTKTLPRAGSSTTDPEPPKAAMEPEPFTAESFLPGSEDDAEEYKVPSDEEGMEHMPLQGSLDDLSTIPNEETGNGNVETAQFEEPAAMSAAGSVTSLISNNESDKGMDKSIVDSTAESAKPSDDAEARLDAPSEVALKSTMESEEASNPVDDEPQPEFDIPKSNLKRSGSLTSLASVMSSNIVSAGNIKGAIKLDISFIPAAQSNKKSLGTVSVLVQECRELGTKDPYVKLYLSKDKKDIKPTKQKSKPQKNTENPLFEQRFDMNVTSKMDLTSRHRLQITVWDHARLRNECMGGTSFSLQEIAAVPSISGWYKLFPYKQGRSEHELLMSAAEEAGAMFGQSTQRAGSLTSLDDESPRPSPRLSRGLLGSASGSAAGSQTSLKRADSLTSLSSIASVNIVSRKNITGLIRLELRFEPADDADATAGTIHVTIKEGRDLGTKEPYIKMYLSKDGKDIKSTKQKTKIQRNTENPLYEERFVFYLPKKTELSDDNRLQITVWDHARLRSNECFGGMSFSFTDIASTTSITGWFHLLAYLEGRSNFRKSTQEMPDMSASKRSSTNSLKKGLANVRKDPEVFGSAAPAKDITPVTADQADPYRTVKSPSRAKPEKESTMRRLIPQIGGKKAKEELQEQLAAALEREEQLQAEVQVLRPMCIENARLHQDLDAANSELETLRNENSQMKTELDELTLSLKRSKQQAAVHKEDADARRTDLAVQRDKHQDLLDENKGLRGYIDNLLQELVKLDMRAVNRASTNVMV